MVSGSTSDKLCDDKGCLVFMVTKFQWKKLVEDRND